MLGSFFSVDRTMRGIPILRVFLGESRPRKSIGGVGVGLGHREVSF